MVILVVIIIIKDLLGEPENLRGPKGSTHMIYPVRISGGIYYTRNFIGWLETGPAQITLTYTKLYVVISCQGKSS